MYRVYVQCIECIERIECVECVECTWHISASSRKVMLSSEYNCWFCIRVSRSVRSNILQCAESREQCTVYSVQCAVCSVQCAVCSVHCACAVSSFLTYIFLGAMHLFRGENLAGQLDRNLPLAGGVQQLGGDWTSVVTVVFYCCNCCMLVL